MLPDPSLTSWLHRLREGDVQALDSLVPLVYQELRTLAHAQLRNEQSGHTIGTTALVHEAYLRLAGREWLEPEDRRHFFAIAAQAMRRVLVDYARARKTLKRGSGLSPIPLEEAVTVLSDQAAEELVVLDAVLERLSQADERAARVVELRFFAGLTLAETSKLLDVSLKTVQRDWIVAQAWLRKEIQIELEIGEGTASGGRSSVPKE